VAGEGQELPAAEGEIGPAAAEAHTHARLCCYHVVIEVSAILCCTRGLRGRGEGRFSP
jgi:hypothetical protein